MKKILALLVMIVFTTISTSAFAAEAKLIGTVTGIKIVAGGAELALKDRKTEAPVILQVRDNMNMEKIRDKKVRVGDELRIRYDGNTKILRTIQKTAGC